MDKGYHKIFWGIFLATFNITLGIIKIVPAFVGWLVVLSGIRVLKTNHTNESFEKSERYVVYLILFALFGNLIGLFAGDAINSSILFSYYPILLSIIELLIIFQILDGTINYLESLDQNNISPKIEIQQVIYKQKTYTILQIISIVGLIIGLITYGALITISAIFVIIVRIYLLTIISGLKRNFIELENN